MSVHFCEPKIIGHEQRERLATVVLYFILCNNKALISISSEVTSVRKPPYLNSQILLIRLMHCLIETWRTLLKGHVEMSQLEFTPTRPQPPAVQCQLRHHRKT